MTYQSPLRVVSVAEDAAEPSGVSWETYRETSSARRFDLHAYQRCFPDRCASYFRATGMTSAELAVAFGVDAKTAKNWLEGIVVPRGDKVARIALQDPAGFAKHFGGKVAA